jgi:hypothetical protein
MSPFFGSPSPRADRRFSRNKGSLYETEQTNRIPSLPAVRAVQRDRRGRLVGSGGAVGLTRAAATVGRVSIRTPCLDADCTQANNPLSLATNAAVAVLTDPFSPATKFGGVRPPLDRHPPVNRAPEAAGTGRGRSRINVHVSSGIVRLSAVRRGRGRVSVYPHARITRSARRGVGRAIAASSPVGVALVLEAVMGSHSSAG